MNYEFEARQVVSRELLPHEIILWHGKPNLRKIFTKYDVFLIPFSLFWGGFAIFWTISASAESNLFGMFGIPFVVIGIYFIFGRFFIKKRNKRNTYYAITNKRIFVLNTRRDGTKKSIVSSNIDTISSETISIDKNGIGTIIFGSISSWEMVNLNIGMDVFMGSSHSNLVAFFDIDDCENVLKVYRRASQRS